MKFYLSRREFGFEVEYASAVISDIETDGHPFIFVKSHEDAYLLDYNTIVSGLVIDIILKILKNPNFVAPEYELYSKNHKHDSSASQALYDAAYNKLLVFFIPVIHLTGDIHVELYKDEYFCYNIREITGDPVLYKLENPESIISVIDPSTIRDRLDTCLSSRWV